MAHRGWGQRKKHRSDWDEARSAEMKRRVTVMAATAVERQADTTESTMVRRTEALRRAAAREDGATDCLSALDRGAVAVAMWSAGILTGALRHAEDGTAVEWADVPALLKGMREAGEGEEEGGRDAEAELAWLEERVDFKPGPSFLLLMTTAVAVSGRAAAEAWQALISAEDELDSARAGVDKGVAAVRRRF